MSHRCTHLREGIAGVALSVGWSRQGVVPAESGYRRVDLMPSHSPEGETTRPPDVMTEQSLFLQLVEMPDPDRSAYLDAACAANPGLRAQVERLLGAHAGAGTFMDR